MFNLENVMKILRDEVNKREQSKTKWLMYRTSGDKFQEEFYENCYHMYCSRFDGMCDMLFDLGYRVWADDDDNIFLDKRD